MFSGKSLSSLSIEFSLISEFSLFSSIISGFSLSVEKSAVFIILSNSSKERAIVSSVSSSPKNPPELSDSVISSSIIGSEIASSEAASLEVTSSVVVSSLTGVTFLSFALISARFVFN